MDAGSLPAPDPLRPGLRLASSWPGIRPSQSPTWDPLTSSVNSAVLMLRQADGRRVEEAAFIQSEGVVFRGRPVSAQPPRLRLWMESHALSMPASRVSGEGCITICRSRKSELVYTYINVFWTLVKCVYCPWSETRKRVCVRVSMYVWVPCAQARLVNCCAHCMHGCVCVHTCVRSGCELSQQNFLWGLHRL